MSKHDCTACGQDLRLPPINFQRMNWILKLFAKITDADQEWVVSRLASDLNESRVKPKKRQKKGRRVEVGRTRGGVPVFGHVASEDDKV